MAFKSTILPGTWGLDRIDQITLPLDGQFRFNLDGGNVDICVVDSGILSNHIEFGVANSTNRVQTLYDYRSTLDPSNSQYVNSNNPLYGVDDNGHGTFMASIIGGITVGVAHGVTLYSVKSFSSTLETTNFWIEDGLTSILNFHLNKTNGRPTVCYIPFSNPPVHISQIEIILKQLHNAGVILIASAGNFNRDIINSFPANLSEVISVAGSNQNDFFLNPALLLDPSFSFPSSSGNQSSNFGNITLIAPSFRIRGAWTSTSLNEINNLSNVQSNNYILFSSNAIAAAFTAGVAALYLDNNSTATPIMVRDFLVNSSVKNIIQGVPRGTPNQFLRSVFNPHVFIWETLSGQIISTPEGTPIMERVVAYGRDGGGRIIPVEYFLSSGQLPQGLTLERLTGRIFGTVGNITSSTPGYIPVNSLPPLDQATFPRNQRGFVDYVFTIRVDNSFGSDVRIFSIRVVDLNVAPEWSLGLTENLNLLFSADAFFYKRSVDFNIQDTPYVIDLDNDLIEFTLLNGELPPGLELSANGAITGMVEAIYPEVYNYPLSAGTISQEFKFTVRATDGDVVVDRGLSLTVSRDGSNNSLPVFEQPTWNVTAVGQFYEGGIVNIIFTAQDNDADKILFYRVQPFTNNDIPPETQIVEENASAQFYDLSDLDFIISDYPWTAEAIVEGSIPATAKVYHRTPVFVNVNVSGKLQGVLTVLNNVGNYYFTLDAYDGWDYTRETFLLKVDPLQIEIVTALASLSWITPEGSLGNIDETYPSYFKVEAFFPEGELINYTFVSGSNSQLPPGITLDTLTGELKGYFGSVSATATFTFAIQATLVEFGTASITGEFSITVNNVWNTNISEFSFNLSGNQKLAWYSLVSEQIDSATTQTLLPRESWYRPNDPIYGENWKPKIYIMGGFPVLTDQEIFDALNLETNVNAPGYESFGNFWGRLRVVFGDIKSAVARDMNGDIIYEVIYYEIIDELQNNGGISNEGITSPIANTDINSPVQFFYPPSINNWRRDLMADLTLENSIERLPLWMMSSQVSANANDALGFVPSIELLYVKPGAGQNLLNTIQFIQTGLIKRGEPIDIDRVTYTDLTDPNNPKSKIIKFPPGDVLR